MGPLVLDRSDRIARWAPWIHTAIVGGGALVAVGAHVPVEITIAIIMAASRIAGDLLRRRARRRYRVAHGNTASLIDDIAHLRERAKEISIALHDLTSTLTA